MENTEKKPLAVVATLLIGLTEAEAEGRPFPESYGYILVGMDMDYWSAIRDSLIESRYITITPGHAIELTDLGREKALQCEEILAA